VRGQAFFPLVGAAALSAIAALGILPGCANKPRSTTLTVSDIESTAAEMAAKLGGSELLAARTPESPPMVIAINKVENLTSDLIPESEQWYLMQKVRGSLPIVNLGKERNVKFVIPVQHLREGRESGAYAENVAAERRPTHEMSATFRSATRAASLDRTEVYMCEYRITDLTSGELEWTEIVEFKRAAFGRAYD